MPRKLNDQELKVLNELANDKELMGKRFIKRFIIRNTYEPKYKVGDYVKVSDDTFTYIWGCRIKGVNARITEVSFLLGGGIDDGDECVQYELECYDQFGKSHFLCAEESVWGKYEKRHIVGLSNTDQNTFEKKSEHSDSISVMW